MRSKGQVRTGREDPCEAPPMIQIIIKTWLNLKDARNKGWQGQDQLTRYRDRICQNDCAEGETCAQ